MGVVMDRILVALNAHDLDAFVGCFASDYRSEQPVQPGREFQGSDKVRENWSSVFAGVPDFGAELLTACTTADGVEIGEWRWQGTYTDGAPFAMRGLIVLGIEADRIAWGRLYMEPVEEAGAGIEQTVRRMAEGD